MEEKQNIYELASHLGESFKRVMVGQVDNYVAFVVRIDGHYLFHQHPRDEMYLVLEGELTVDYDDGSSVVLKKGDCWTAQAGVRHRSGSKEGAVVLIFKDRAYLRGKESS